MKKAAIAMCILWMGFIFYMSSFNGAASNEKSFSVAKSIQSSTSKSKQSKLPKTKADKKINLFLRKNAHAFEYLVLAVLIGNALLLHKIQVRNVLLYALFICLLYAVLDEYHQSFVPGRTSLVSDVLIDFVGSLLGITLYYFFRFMVAVSRKRLRN